MKSSLQRSSYRPEIDGLRAFAVVGVVLFHMGLGFPGGYVGVDVFFVISGYLITSIVASELSTETFSLRRFWTRRIRRILPASAFMVMVVAVASGLLLVSSDFSRVMRATFWQAAMLANYFYQQDVGYFAEQAENKPLLHTWSLAVEEQFYIFYPPLLVGYRRFVSKNLLPLIIAMGVISLAVCVWQTPREGSAAFFLLPARAWEMLAGASLAFWPVRKSEKSAELKESAEKKGSSKVAEVVAFLGAAAVGYAMLQFTKQTVFPGQAAMVPVVGVSAIIIGCTNHKTLIGSLLSWWPFLMIGRMSYSIYLWHWPLLVFANLLLVDVSGEIRIALAVLSVLISIPSYYWIENPFRRSPFLSSPKRAFGFAAGVLIPLLIVSFMIVKARGFPQLTSEATQCCINDIEWIGGEYVCYEGQPVSIGVDSDKEAVADFVLWGDSHAMATASAFNEIAIRNGLKGDVYADSATPPVPGVGKRGEERNPEKMTAINRSIKERILEDGVRSVVLVARWSACCSGVNQVEIDAGAVLNQSMVVDAEQRDPPDAQASARILRHHLGVLLSELDAAGVNVWVVNQVPECALLAPARDFMKTVRFPQLNSLASLQQKGSISWQAHLERQELANWVLSIADDFPNVRVVDPSHGFFDDNESLKVFAERSYYRDDDHLTRYGAEELLGPCIESILKQIKLNKQEK